MTNTRSAEPTIEVAHRPGECPKCKHTADEQSEPQPPSRLRQILRLRPRSAECGAYMQEFETGFGGMTDCTCRHAFHGS